MSRHRKGPDRAPVDAEGYRRVHRLTPLMRFWSTILAIITIAALNFSAQTLRDVEQWLVDGHAGEASRNTIISVAGFVALCLGIWFISAIWWRKLGFKLSEEELSLRHGVISTTFRSARYERIQAVDVVESVIARIFGLAAVRVETAGGQSSVIEIMYLKKPDALALREEVLAHMHGQARHQPAPAETPDFIEPVPVLRTLVSTALRMRVIIMVAIMAALWFSPVSRSTVVPLLVGIVPSIWGIIDDSWKYRAIHNSEKGVLEITYGLADRRRQSIRLDRIHGVRVMQPVLWRLLGWYEVQVSVAGYGTTGGGKRSGSTRILPVGTRAQAMKVFALVSDLTAEEIEIFARPEGHTHPTFTSPSRAWPSSPLDVKRQAVTLVRDVAITHEGRFNRRVMAVGTPHIQELSYQAGPIRQALKVGTVRFQLVLGPVRMQAADLEPADAAVLLTRLRARRLPAMDAAPLPPLLDIENVDHQRQNQGHGQAGQPAVQGVAGGSFDNPERETSQLNTEQAQEDED